MSKIQRLVLDGYDLNASNGRGSAIAAAIARQRALNDAASAAAQERYEAHLMREARAIAGGRSQAQPTVEHVRLLLAALDRSGTQMQADAAF